MVLRFRWSGSLHQDLGLLDVLCTLWRKVLFLRPRAGAANSSWCRQIWETYGSLIWLLATDQYILGYDGAGGFVLWLLGVYVEMKMRCLLSPGTTDCSSEGIVHRISRCAYDELTQTAEGISRLVLLTCIPIGKEVYSKTAFGNLFKLSTEKRKAFTSVCFVQIVTWTNANHDDREKQTEYSYKHYL